MKTKTTGAIVPKSLQILFIISAVTAYLIQVGTTIYYSSLSFKTAENAPTPNEFYYQAFMWLGSAILIPLVIIAILFVTRRDKAVSVSSLFQVMTLGVAFLFIFSAFTQAASMLIPVFPATSGFAIYTALTIAIPLIVVICGLILTILHLRRQKQW